MILFNAVVEILAVPVADIGTKLASNRTRVPPSCPSVVTRAGVTLVL